MSVRARRVMLRVALPLLLCLAACDVEFTEQELVVRYRPELDAVDVLLIYHGLTAPNDSEKAATKAADWIEPLLEAGRHMMLVDWPLQFDLEKWEAKLQEKLASLPEGAASTPADAHARRQAERAQRVLAQISVPSSGLFLDGQGRLCGWQPVRVDGITQLLDTANQMLSAKLIESLQKVALDDLTSDEAMTPVAGQALLGQQESAVLRLTVSIGKQGGHVESFSWLLQP